MSGEVAQGAARSFASASDIDFSSSAGLQQLLSVVRTAPLPRSVYNDLRDLIFSYKHSNEDPAAQALIVQKLAEAGIVPAGSVPDVASVPVSDPEINRIPIKIQTEPTPVTLVESKTTASSFAPRSERSGTVRPQPQFAKVTPTVHATPVVAEVIHTPESAASITPVAPTPTPAVEAQAAEVIASELTVNQVAPEVPVDPTPVAMSPAAEITPEVPVTSAPANDSDARIKEIKREVNALVGNPVNLIDADNTIGREYMNALLDAMKKLSGGSAEDLSAAMVRLEAAYEAVKTMSPKFTAPVVQQPKPAPAPTPATPVSTQSELAHSMMPEVGLPKSRLFDRPEPVEPVVPEPVSTVLSAAVPETPLFTPVAAVASEDVQMSETLVPTPAPSFQSVADTKASQENELNNTIAEARAATAEEVARLSAMDPVMVPAVTTGLQQLLSEWALFKSSGLFGTGPSGMEHPLYQKLANLQMSAIVAGRFEGATPEIRQSISDYMNGWRYEEGILHQHGETFEHYLRRVIKKILDRKSQAIADGA